MSMLTPPGMGGKYRITGDKFPHMRRRPRGRGRIALVLVASVAALGLLGWGTFQLIDVFSGGGTADAASGAKHCPRPSARPAQVKKVPAPDQIKVNVLNATPREGLAKKTADELKKRGFTIGEVGNAPKTYDKKVRTAGLLLGAPTASGGAFDVLGTQLTGARTRTDTRKGGDVDLIIGDGFKQLTTPAVASKALTTLRNPAPAPAPTC
ncbi:LytR C-terminal domain-containing protein [Streptomyces sp. NPDC049954]|uniref:LytR C-terminal domain-containing protein n=1 Tax=Streptomyces sp. NPDC049954 TaxID=3155779 RepID=UPI0034356F82